MRRLLGAAVAVLLLAAPAPARAWGYDVHRFIMDHAIALLPPELRPVFEKNRAIVVERSIDPDTWRVAGFGEEDPNHFLNIDWGGYGTYPFTGLPREYGAAVARFGVEDLRRQGRLPWRIEEVHGNLRRAFEAYAANPIGPFNIVLFSAALSHYISDATQPFHTAANFDGQMTGQRGIHSRFETILFERYRSRLTIAPPAIPPVRTPLAFAFDTILESQQLAALVLKADAEAIGNRDAYDDVYYEAFFRGAGPVFERRVNTAIGAVAAMIAGAWEAAGKPAVRADPPPRPLERRRRP